MRTFVAFALLFAGCTTDVHDHEDEPVDLKDNLHLQGVIDCSESTNTGYTQGTAFTITVVTVDGKPVERETANAYYVMQQAAAADGVSIRIVSGFRTMAQQEYFWGCYQNCNCNSCNLAARPGYSNHQSGHALDLNTSESGVLTWLNNHGDEYGFARTVSSEPWHWEWWGGGPGGGPCVDAPAACVSGDYDGSFCDDEGGSAEDAHDCVAEAGVMGQCKLIEGEPAFCGSNEVTRAKAAQVTLLLGGLDDPSGFPDAFDDDDGHPLEPWLNAAKHYGILLGGGGNANPDGIATRSTVAILVSRLYALPAQTTDSFTDDDGTGSEPYHEKVKAAGLMTGYGAEFRGGERATRNTLAIVGCRGLGSGLVAHWLQPPPPPPAATDAGTTEEPPPPPPVEGAIDPIDETTPADVVVVDDQVALPETEPPPTGPRYLPPSVQEGCAAAGGDAPVVLALLLLLGSLGTGARRIRRPS